MQPSGSALFVSTLTGWGWGGSEVLWSRCARGMLDQGWKVGFSCDAEAERQPSIQELISAGAIPHYRRKTAQASVVERVVNKIRTKRVLAQEKENEEHWLLSLIAEMKPNVICVSCSHAYEAYEYAEVLPRVRAMGIAVTLLSQLEFDWYALDDLKRGKLRSAYEAASSCVFVSHNGAQLLERQLACRFPTAHIIYNPCDSSREMIDWPAAPHVKRWAHVGRLSVAHKGQDKLLQALSSDSWRSREWELTFYGEGPDEAYIRELAAMYQIDTKVQIAGHIADVVDIWRREEVCLLPTNAEGTSLAMLEAMHAGRPVLATDIGGAAEWVEDGETGWIAPARTSRSIALALERAWEMQSDWQQMGRRAHERVRTRASASPEETLAKVVTSAHICT